MRIPYSRQTKPVLIADGRAVTRVELLAVDGEFALD
jgi:hypothetical protein